MADKMEITHEWQSGDEIQISMRQSATKKNMRCRIQRVRGGAETKTD